MEILIWLLVILNAVMLWKLGGMRRLIEELQRLQEKTQKSVDWMAHRPATAAAPPLAPAEKPAPGPVLKPVAPAAAPAAKPLANPPPMPHAVAVTPMPSSAPIWAVAPPKPPSKTAEAAREILQKMWNWFLWNQETRPAGVSLEYAIASTWLLRIGILGVVMFVAFFLRWSYQQHLLGPGAQVGITIFTGLGMLVGGMRLLGKKYNLIGQGLLGGGLLSLYFSVYATGPGIHRLLPIEGVFGLMILVTVVAGFLSVRVNSLLIAVLGLAGGYLTPVLLRTSTPALPGFYSYVLLLTVGILAVAARKQWRLLHYLSFVFTYALFIGSLLDAYRGKPDFWVAISFLTAFFVLHSAMPAIHNVLRGAATTVLEIIHIVANAALYAALGYRLVADAWGRPYPALLSLGLALFFAAHVGMFLWKRLQDRTLLVCLLALAGAFTMWTLPLVMEKEALTICLALLAFVFLWMGRKIGSVFLQNLGQALYLAVFARLLVLDLPRNYGHLPFGQQQEAQYWKGMLDRLWTFGISIGSVAAAFLVQRRNVPVNPRLSVAAATDIPEVIPRTWTAAAFFWFGVLFAFLFAHLELSRMFGFWPSMRPPVLTALWCGMAGYFLWKYLFEERSPVFFAALFVFVLGALLKLFAYDVMLWRVDEFIYRVDYTALLALARLLDFGLPLLLLLAGFRLFAARPECRAASAVFGYGALALLFAYTSLELNSLLFCKLKAFRAGGISVLWAFFGVSFITGGIWRNVRLLRYAGLLLCAIVVGKVIMDTAPMEMMYRFIAYLVLGVLLLLGSFAYIYSSRKFTTQDEEKHP
jgi:uncharacterized membrane protein